MKLLKYTQNECRLELALYFLMKILSREFEPSKRGGGQAGRVTLIPEENEDIWHLYNMASKGDSLRYISYSSLVLSVDFIFTRFECRFHLHSF